MEARADLGGIGNSGADTTFAGNWQLFDRGDIFGDTTPEDLGNQNDGTTLIFFSGEGLMQGGDLVYYRDPTNTYEFTVRLYNNADDVLFAAFEEQAADLDSPAVAADGEFYLLTTATDSGVVWTTTTIASRGVFGYDRSGLRRRIRPFGRRLNVRRRKGNHRQLS